MQPVDLFVIGAGSGGVRAARIAAQHGAKVVIAEADRVGGTCVIRGCVPKKLYVMASRYADAFIEAPAFGWDVGAPTFNWQQLRDRVAAEVTRLEGLYRANLEKAGVQIFNQRAMLDGANTVVLADGQRFHAKHILIATGGRPSMPAVAGAEYGIVSDDVFHLPTLPRRMVIVGGGFIALEFAALFARLGVVVEVVHRSAFLKGFERLHVEAVLAAMSQRGVIFHRNSAIEQINLKGDQRQVRLKSGGLLEADVVLFATGRTPNVQNLGLEGAGVALGKDGAIAVDASSQTSVPHIYAVGDVTNRINLTPVAIREGHAFADSVFGSQPRVMDHSLVPHAVFTTPELASVGLTTEQAEQQKIAVTVYKTNFRPMRAALAGLEERTHMMLVVDAQSNIVLGCHIVGEHAAEMVQLAAIAVRAKLTKADFDQTVALHPTAAEELVTMR